MPSKPTMPTSMRCSGLRRADDRGQPAGEEVDVGNALVGSLDDLPGRERHGLEIGQQRGPVGGRQRFQQSVGAKRAGLHDHFEMQQAGPDVVHDRLLDWPALASHGRRLPDAVEHAQQFADVEARPLESDAARPAVVPEKRGRTRCVLHDLRPDAGLPGEAAISAGWSPGGVKDGSGTWARAWNSCSRRSGLAGSAMTARPAASTAAAIFLILANDISQNTPAPGQGSVVTRRP